MAFDTICAVATARGAGGISIVRVSGNDAISIVSSIFVPKRRKVRLEERPTHSLTLGYIVDGEKIVDEVLVSIMREPASYTGENVVEINCHGGFLPARTVLSLLLTKGCRMAEPGEFTRRAFLNGKLSLNQAEAIIDVINARSEKGLELAVSGLAGRAAEALKRVEDRVIYLAALVEASIDFPEEVGELDVAMATNITDELIKELEKMLDVSEKARFYREGLKVVISGKPNVGKSTLLNRLIQENKVIVSDIPGTTRDIIEDYLDIKGIPIQIVDTAGIRETDDKLEAIGVERSRQQIIKADLVILVLDVVSGITDEDRIIINMIRELGKRVIILINKVDLPCHRITDEEIRELSALGPVIKASFKEDRGVEELKDTIFEITVGCGIEPQDNAVLINIRQRAAVKRALRSLQSVSEDLSNGVSLDCLAVDIMDVRDAIGEITGKTVKEDVVDRIFAEFCIGK